MSISRITTELALQAPVFHRAETAGARISKARRYLAEASLLQDEAEYPGMAGSVRAAWRSQAGAANRSARRLISFASA